MAKHFELAITDNSFNFSRKDTQISAEAALDGIYVVRASAAHTEGLPAGELVRAYNDRGTGCPKSPEIGAGGGPLSRARITPTTAGGTKARARDTLHRPPGNAP